LMQIIINTPMHKMWIVCNRVKLLTWLLHFEVENLWKFKFDFLHHLVNEKENIICYNCCHKFFHSISDIRFNSRYCFIWSEWHH
jgi:hypothetical protein